MSTRPSGFERVPADLYQTPAWVIDALAEHINLNGLCVWEPACGEGQMARALEAHGAQVIATDMYEYGYAGQVDTFDFLSPMPRTQGFYFDSIITNNPYGPGGRTSMAFIQRGLERLPTGGLLALLLPVDFDSGSTRIHLFEGCPAFAAKIVLRRRIAWFEPQPGQAGPSANHAWFIWVRNHLRAPRAPVTLYAPSNAVEKTSTLVAA